MITNKIIHMYYLNKLYDSLNKLCDSQCIKEKKNFEEVNLLPVGEPKNLFKWDKLYIYIYDKRNYIEFSLI